MPTIPFADTAELARILKIRAPTDEQEIALQRCLDAAAGEIVTEIDLVEPADELEGWGLALATEVNLERAVEHWKQQEAAFGIIGFGADLVATRAARDTWDRHALKLAPLKEQWGIA